MARIGHQEHGLDVLIEALVHGRHLELVLEVRDRPQPPDNDVGVQLFGEVHQQGRERLHHDLAGDVRNGLAQHLHPLFGREQGSLVVVLGYADDHAVHQLGRARDDVGVPVGDRIEGARIQPDAHLRRLSPSLSGATSPAV